MKGALRLSYALCHAATAATVVTGIVYGVMRYFCEPVDAYAVVNHPLEPLFHTLHVLLAPSLALMLGAFWISHAWTRFLSGAPEGRMSGLGLMVTALPMVFSGYLIQTATSPLWSDVWKWLHDVTSLLWTVMFIAHLFTHTRRAES